LFREHIDVLMFLAQNGYRIRITGHSLGGGVATLLGSLVLRHMVQETSFDISTHALRVYGFGTPACVDGTLSDFVKPFVTTVVLHDDVVPRLTPTSIRGLLKHLLHIRETWVKTHLTKDLMAITARAKTAWAPRWRNGFTLGQASLKTYCRKQIQYGKRKLLSVKGKLVRKISGPSETNEGAPTDNGAIEPKLAVDFLGGIDQDLGAVVLGAVIVDGDEFFDTAEKLVESEDEMEENMYEEKLKESIQTPNPSHATEDDDESWSNYDEQSSKHPDLSQSETFSYASEFDGLEEPDEPCSAVVLDETPLPRMYLPGKIIHIYTHRGGYKATYVPRAFRELRRISMAGNMLSDHTCRAYYEALLEVQTVRNAAEGLPRWTAFDEDDTCSCCASRFTWASTSNSEAQEARDKHNCRSCGSLVCNPCSTNRIPIPAIGLTIPVRVCDRCYNNIGGVRPNMQQAHRDSWTMRKGETQPERQRERRSFVVDELASRIHSTVTCT